MTRLAVAALLARALWATRQVPLPRASLAEVRPSVPDAVAVFDAVGVKAGAELGEDRADADKEPIGDADPADSGSDSGRPADAAKAGAGVKAVAPAAHITDFSEEDATRFVRQLGGVGRLRDIMARLGLEDGAASPPRMEPEAQHRDDEEPAEKRRRREEGAVPSLPSEPADGTDHGATGILGEKVDELAKRLEARQKGDLAVDIFGHWSEEIMNEPQLVPELIRWMESTSGMRFLIKAFGKIRSVSKLKQQLKEAAKMMGLPLDAMQAFSEAAPELKETLLGFFMQWDMRMSQRADTESPLDFTFTKNATERLRDIARLQARILLKAGKFFVSCDLKEGKDVREMRFRTTVSGGRRVLEARYLGSADKFPNLESWITLTDFPEDVIFVGLEGRRAVDSQSQFYHPLEAMSLNETLPGASAFALDMFDGEPVIMLYDALRTETEGRTLWARCPGATTRRALSHFVKELQDTIPACGTF